MIRLLILIILIYLLYKIVDSVRQLKLKKSEDYQIKSSPASGEDLVEDPVCHTYVPVSQAYQKEILGKIYFFCSKQCGDQYVMEKK